MSPTFRPLRAASEVAVLEALEDLGLRTPAPDGGPRTVGVLVASADGRIVVDGRAAGLGSATDRAVLRGLRALCDCVLVGSGTLDTERYGRMLDDEQLDHRRAAGRSPKPLVATVSRSLSLDPTIPLLGEDDQRVRVYTDAPGGEALTARRARVELVRPSGGATVAAALADLTTREDVRLVACEGGPRLLGELVRAGLLSDLVLTVAPLLVGGEDPLTLLAGAGPAVPTPLTLAEAWRDGDHLFLHYRVGPVVA